MIYHANIHFKNEEMHYVKTDSKSYMTKKKTIKNKISAGMAIFKDRVDLGILSHNNGTSHNDKGISL